MNEDRDCGGEQQVGYGKPPLQTQFRKGVSGNPRGRPKGSKNLATIVTQVGKQMVQIKTQNGSRKATKVEATILQLSNQAIQGNLPAMRSYLALIQNMEQLTQVTTSDYRATSGSDGAVHAALVKRLKRLMSQAGEMPTIALEGASE